MALYAESHESKQNTNRWLAMRSITHYTHNTHYNTHVACTNVTPPTSAEGSTSQLVDLTEPARLLTTWAPMLWATH